MKKTEAKKSRATIPLRYGGSGGDARLGEWVGSDYKGSCRVRVNKVREFRKE